MQNTLINSDGKTFSAGPILFDTIALHSICYEFYKSGVIMQIRFLFIYIILQIFLVESCTSTGVSAKKTEADSPLLFRKNESKVLIDKIISLLLENYIEAELVEKKEEILRNELRKVVKGNYKNFSSLQKSINEVMLATLNDKHLGLRIKKEQSLSEELEAARRWIIENNFGFKNVYVKDGIGYVELSGFIWPRVEVKELKKKIFEIFSDLNNCRALIFDVRKNGGGSPEMVATVSSFILPVGTKLNTFHWRDPKGIKLEWINTLPKLFDAKLATVERREKDTIERYQTINEYDNFGLKSKLRDVPIVVLTSKETFSAAEEFAYNLKHLNRATIIGEVTGGGANPNSRFDLPFGLELLVPNGEAKNAITNSNWEKIGVHPDFEIKSEDALDFAINHLNAMSR